MAKNTYPVTVQTDFLSRVAKSNPIQAISELIWNSLDADATRVDVELVPDPLGGFTKIVISDNGTGINPDDAPKLFSSLGGSWKRHGARTAKGRMLHGQEGRGRFKALALGRVVDWRVVWQIPDGTFITYDISIVEDNIQQVSIAESMPISAVETGVTVVISELKQSFSSLAPEKSLQDFAEIFAIYLRNYSDVLVRIQGEKIDPERAILESNSFSLMDDDRSPDTPFALDIVEWRRSTKKALYLCNEQGFPLAQIDTRMQVGDHKFSGYIKSKYISDLHQENRLELAELDALLADKIEEAKSHLKIHFRNKAAERARTVVDQWIETRIYPFEGEAANKVERAERQVFDIVAVTVQEISPDFESMPQTQKAMHLRMLRSAIEHSPQELQKILQEVLKLPAAKQKELALLLDEVSLSGVITAANVVADRLKFISGLEAILFDPDMKKRLKERSQLHKILETSTWIFGEEYNLWVSDRSLTEVLRQHRNHLDPDIVIDEPVKHVSQERGIVDLMLSRAQRKHRADDIEHLVIELKAPKVVLTPKELSQIDDYALSVAEDDRFKTVKGVRWHFWLISDSYDKRIQFQLDSSPKGRLGIVREAQNISVGVKTWAQIIEENRARLQFFQEHLNHKIDQSDALAFLHERHRQFLEGVVIKGETEPSVEPSKVGDDLAAE